MVPWPLRKMRCDPNAMAEGSLPGRRFGLGIHGLGSGGAVGFGV